MEATIERETSLRATIGSSNIRKWRSNRRPSTIECNDGRWRRRYLSIAVRTAVEVYRTCSNILTWERHWWCNQTNSHRLPVRLRRAVVIREESFDSNRVGLGRSTRNVKCTWELFSADVYSTLARTTSPSHRLDPPVDANQTRSAGKWRHSPSISHYLETFLAINSKRSGSPGSLISNILESPEPDKVHDTQRVSCLDDPFYSIFSRMTTRSRRHHRRPYRHRDQQTNLRYRSFVNTRKLAQHRISIQCTNSPTITIIIISNSSSRAKHNRKKTTFGDANDRCAFFSVLI